MDEQDYNVFLSYLATYLSPKDEHFLQNILTSTESSAKEKVNANKLLRLKNYFGSIHLICYALLPNHFHLLIKEEGIDLHSFMNSIGTRYSMYFNRKYHRHGVLFQDVYKAVLIQSDEQLLVLSRYIHLNPTRWMNLPVQQWFQSTLPNSLPEYLGKRKTSWIKTLYILDYFSKTQPTISYESFIGLNVDEELIGTVILEED